MSTQLFTA